MNWLSFLGNEPGEKSPRRDIMQKIKTGNMIYQIRKSKQISGRKLCAGICSLAALSKYECGERTPDGLLFHYFMQRMGMAPDDFAVLLSEEEYQYYIWKEKMISAIQNREWETAESLLHSEEAMNRSCNEKIQKQFYFYAASVYTEWAEKNYKLSIQFLKEAVQQTVPDFLDNDFSEYQLSTMEIQLIVMYFYKGGQQRFISSNEVYVKLCSLLSYARNRDFDKRECVRLISEITCAILNVCKEQMNVWERLSMEEEAVKLLKESYKMYHLPELLRFYVDDLVETDREKAQIYERQYQVFLQVYEDNGYDPQFQPELIFDRTSQVYLLDEYMRSYREISGMTQEQASEGICAPETYSRIETGKRVPRPKAREALLERLGISWGYFRGDLETTDYTALELLNKYRQAGARSRWQEAECYVRELKRKLDMESVNNRQYVGMMENHLAYATGRMTAQEIYDRDKELLELSITEERLNKTDIYYFSRVEILLHTHIANVLDDMGRKQEAIELLERLLRKTEKSAVEIEYWWHGMNATIFNLANMLSDIGRCEEALAYMERFTDKCMKMYDGKFLACAIGERGYDLEHLGSTNSEICKRMYEQVVYMMDFYEMERHCNIIKNYYEKYYDAEKKWYGK